MTSENQPHREEDARVFFKPFGGTKKTYFRVSVLVGLYVNVSVYGIYAATRFLLVGDRSVYELQTLLWPLIGFVAYVVLSYSTIKRLDGIGSEGRGWVDRSVRVKLIETRKHRRIG